MIDISKLLILVLLLNYITSLQIETNDNQKEAVEIKFGSAVNFDKTNNYFKFTYNGDNDTQIYLRFEESIVDIYLTDPEGGRQYLESDERDDRIYKGNLTDDGIYYLELVCQSFLCELGSKFMIIYPQIVETIDLSKNIYYQNFGYYINQPYLGMIQYQVKNLNEEKYVFFIDINNDDYDKRYYVPYYPGEDPPPNPYGPNEGDFSNLTIFEVINNTTKECKRNVRFYKFEQGNEYTINIHCLIDYYSYEWGNNFRYVKYMFIPKEKSEFQKVTGDEGIVFSDVPIFGLVNSNNQKNFTLIGDVIAEDNIYYTMTEQDIEKDLEILSSLEFSQETIIDFKSGKSQNTFFVVVPPNFDSGVNLYIVDEVIYDCLYSYTIPANTARVIICDEGEKKDQFEYFNYLLTYKSDFQNMRILFSEDKEASDYIIQNYLGLPIYVDKTDKECTITKRNYTTKFAYFGAENSYIFNSFFSVGKKMLNIDSGIDLSNYLKLIQMNLRIGSEYIPWFEFYNVYFNQLDIKVNLYIRQFRF